jgi:DtxR family Mn-dependent transcriptional regulator
MIVLMTLHELKNQFPAAPEYLTQIFLIERDQGTVPNARLAERLKVSRPAVSQAIGRLKRLDLVKQTRYGVIKLTAEGRKVAENVVKRHFLLEHVLVNVLDYPWDKSDVEAGTLQASLSEELTGYLVERLGNPQTCPHGNPLPGSSIEKHYLDAPSLAEAKTGSRLKIIRITEEGEMTDGMLSFCQEHRIAPGLLVEVLDSTADGVKCSDGKSAIFIPAHYAVSVRWEPAQTN